MQVTGKGKCDPDRPCVYQIRLRGSLDNRWANWFDGMTVTLAENGDTLLTGPAQDQAALLGLIAKVRDLGIQLVYVIPFEPGQTDTPSGNKHNQGND